MNPVLDDILRSGCVTGPSGERIPLHSQISREEGEFLCEIVAAVRPSQSLEIGLAYGVSALFLCDALVQVGAERHVVIDPHQFGVPPGQLLTADPDSTRTGFGGIGVRNLQRAGYGSLVELHELPSHVALPRLLEQGRRIDFAFIDGWHTFDYVMVDFFYVDKLLRPGGVVVFDDANYRSIRKLCRYVVTNLPYSTLDARRHPQPPARSWRSRLLMRMPLVGSYAKRIAKPEFLEPDGMLGLARGRYLALRKDRDDVLGDGTCLSRRWDFHRDF